MLKKINFKKANLPLIAFCAFLTKMLIFSPTYADGLIMGCLSAVLVYKMKYKLQEPQDINDKYKQEIQELKNAVSKVNMGTAVQPGNKKFF